MVILPMLSSYESASGYLESVDGSSYCLSSHLQSSLFSVEPGETRYNPQHVIHRGFLPTYMTFGSLDKI
jgi:hypothetical protein